MRELKYNDFNSSITTFNRYFYSHSTNLSNYLSYNNVHHYHQQVQFKRLSFRIRNQYQRQLLRSYRDSQQNQENNIQNSTNKVRKKNKKKNGGFN